VNGQCLIEHLQTHAGWLQTDQSLSELRDTIARVGRWVRVFQQVSPTGGLGDIEQLRQYIDIRLERLVRDSRGDSSTPTGSRSCGTSTSSERLSDQTSCAR
jgi:hypothetical protein